MKPLCVAGVVAAGLALAACGSSSSSGSSKPSTASTPAATSSSPSSSTAGAAATVVMTNVAFAPGTLHAKVGQTVTFRNQDNPPHNVTYVSGPKFTSSGTINPGQSFTLKLTQAGTIHYFCTIHPLMKAEIVVSK
jgi:plastocyanin